MISNEWAFLLERLRFARGFNSQEALTDQIVDVRQYRRYLSGSSAMPFDVIQKLIERLNMKVEDVLKVYYQTTKDESIYIHRVYNLLMIKDYLAAEKLIENNNSQRLMNIANQQFLDFCSLYLKFKIQRLNAFSFASHLMKLIKIDNLKNFEVFTLYELIMVSHLLEVVEPPLQTELIVKLSKVVKEIKRVDNDSIDLYVLLLFTLVKHQGISKNYLIAIELCHLAISVSTEYRHYYLLDFFYYFEAICYHELGDLRSRDISLQKCYHILCIEQDKQQVKLILDLIKKDFGVTFEDTNLHTK